MKLEGEQYARVITDTLSFGIEGNDQALSS